MIIVPIRRMSVSSGALDLPGAVGLAAGGPVALLLLAADDDRLAVLPAVLAVGELVGARGRDRAGVAGLRVVPHRRLPGLVLLERLLRRLRRHAFVAGVEAVPDEAADQRAANSGPGDRAPPASGERRDPGTGPRADHGTEDGLRVVLDGRARGQHERDDHERRERGGGTTTHLSSRRWTPASSTQARSLQALRA